MRILVADDSKTNLTIITSALQKLGHDVTAVSSGKEAIDKFLVQRPDLIILDVVMNEMDGFECARQIRAINTEDWIPIIFLSASVDDENISKGIDAGGDDYLTKPFSEITLAAKIKAMQRISDMRQKLFETTQQLVLLSATDALTNIYNRFQFDRSIIEKLAEAQRYERTLALMFIDLDNFKIINDTFGHHVGDLLLIEVAKRLKSCIRTHDFLARIGGDEFAIILTEIESPAVAGHVAQKIINAIAPDYQLENHGVRVGTSIGIACFPEKGTTEENLIQNADIAMYHAKSLGRNNYQYFTEELNEQYKQQLNLEHALRFALERNEMFLTYQPIFNLNTKQIIGIEALINWDHPKFGLISPSTLIPLAEETGLINTIGGWVIRTACKDANKWKLKNIKNFKLAINVSSHQFLHENFFELMIDVINESQISPQIIELELTESTVMGDKSGVFKDTMKRLRDFGITIALDDFGTGYSSLTRLKKIEIDTLKIDKVFVQDSVSDVNSAIIVNCLIALSKNLQLQVIAEGIETGEQLDFLIAGGCSKGQGYYLCKPMAAEKMEKYLKDAQLELI